MRYTRSEDSSSFIYIPNQRDQVNGSQKKLKRIVLFTDEEEQLIINRKRNQFRQWMKIMQWAIIDYVPDEELNRPSNKLYFRSARFVKNKIMNEITLTATPTPVHSEYESSSIHTIFIDTSEEQQPKRLNEYEDNYLRTLLDEKCLMYPPQKIKR